MHLRHVSCVNGLAVHSELLLEYAKLFEPLRKFKSNDVLVDPACQLNLDLESHRDFSAAANEILRLYQVAYSVRILRYFLQNLQGKANGRLARAVFTNQKDRGPT